MIIYKKKKKKKKKRTSWIVDIAFQADYKVKTKEKEKRDKYLDFTGELKKQWNMKMSVIQIVYGAFGKRAGGVGPEDEPMHPN